MTAFPALMLCSGRQTSLEYGDRLLGSTSAGKSARAPQATPHNHLLNQRASVGAVWFFFGSDDYCGGYAVAGFEVQQADALGVAAGFADGF